jgi:uncharacterized protein
MDLTAAEGRVLGCLLERQVADPEADSSLDDVRFACNQAAAEAVTYDDRTVQQALLSLKSKGLARFVAAGHTVGPVRYRHRADQRWRLSVPEMAVLARLLLGGPQTADEVRVQLRQLHDAVEEASVEAALDALAGRTPTPFAVRITTDKWEGTDTLWAEVLTGEPSFEDLHRIARRQQQARAAGPRQDTLPSASSGAQGKGPTPGGGRPAPTLADLADRLTKIERRLAGIEAALTSLRSGSHESSRVIR